MNFRSAGIIIATTILLAACGDEADKSASNVATNTQTNNGSSNSGNSSTINANSGTTPNAGNANNVEPANNIDNMTGCSEPLSSASLGLTAETPPAPYDAIEGVTFYEGVAYGDDPQNVFDILVRDSAEPARLVIYIHGGGFTGGSRKQILNVTEEVTPLLDQGFAFATIDYRLLEAPGVETEGVIKPLTDSRRAVQFIRRHAADFNIDPDVIGLAGRSAGAGTSLWIGLQDEACDPDAQDGVLQTSTRVQAVAATETQATYDLKKWDTEVYGDDYPQVTLANATRLGPALYLTIAAFYGLPSDWMNLADLEQEPLVTYRAQVDMLAMPDASDPPIFLSNLRRSTGMPTDIGALLHHPLHAEAVFEAATSAGVEDVQLYTPDISDGRSGTWPQFMIDVLAP